MGTLLLKASGPVYCRWCGSLLGPNSLHTEDDCSDAIEQIVVTDVEITEQLNRLLRKLGYQEIA